MFCTICYNSKIKNISSPNCCDHVFCYKCLKEWHKIDCDYDYFARCPICRQYFNEIKKLTKNSYVPRITRSKTRDLRANEIKNRCSNIINQISEICGENNQKKINDIVYDKLIPELLKLFYDNKWFLLDIEKFSTYNEKFINILYDKLDEFEKMGFVESKIWKWKFRELLK
jgi:hypothetical protein|uniref:RING-type domain-containing protein n=1 Tax=viral metagenome TaxID=1070528 RepID=A0A6C0ALX4_9ZZZZ